MFTINGITYRNVREQIGKNKDDIETLESVQATLKNYGINIVGAVDLEQDLPKPYEGNYGDAFIVGLKPPFDYYIYLKDNNWYNLGNLAIQGPAGPEGKTPYIGANGNWFIDGKDTGKPAQGEKGPVGSVGPVGPQGAQSTTPGPAYVPTVDSSGNLSWTITYGLPPITTVNIKGPKGDTGDVAGFININGILENSDQLPKPIDLKDLTIAYLVGVKAPYDVWIQVGSSSATAKFMNMGPINVATFITVNGKYQNTWNADTKADQTELESLAAIVDSNITDIAANNQDIQTINNQIDGGGFVLTTQQNLEQSKKTQACENIGAVEKTNNANMLYGTDFAGKPFTSMWSSEPYNYTMARRDGNGRLTAKDAVENDECVNLGQADGKYVTKVKESDYWSVYVNSPITHDVTLYNLDKEPNPSTIPYRWKDGTFKVGEPIDPAHPATKKYVDALPQTVKETVAIPEIVDIDTFRTYFYNKRKAKERHYQFEILSDGPFYDFMSFLGYPDGVSTSTSLFLYVDIPYSEAGGFQINLTLMGRNTSEYFTRTMHSTLDSKWQDSGWKDPNASSGGQIYKHYLSFTGTATEKNIFFLCSIYTKDDTPYSYADIFNIDISGCVVYIISVTEADGSPVSNHLSGVCRIYPGMLIVSSAPDLYLQPTDEVVVEDVVTEV